MGGCEPYLRSVAASDKGVAAVKADLGRDAVQGLVFLYYTASSEPGSDYITFTVMDNDDNQTSDRKEMILLSPE